MSEAFDRICNEFFFGIIPPINCGFTYACAGCDRSLLDIRQEFALLPLIE
ncbi:hypothetical protein [Planktothrix sp. FACHB-1355]|nr:hypothetical protein [Planktothrix sp. FACHB-1355]